MVYEKLLYQGGEDKLTFDGAPSKKASISFNICQQIHCCNLYSLLLLHQYCMLIKSELYVSIG